MPPERGGQDGPDAAAAAGNLPLLRRLEAGPWTPVMFTLDGRACTGRDGDTVLTAVLAEQARVRVSEVRAEPRAGLCAIGACQDCWVLTADGGRLRACTTPLTGGMRLITDRAR